MSMPDQNCTSELHPDGPCHSQGGQTDGGETSTGQDGVGIEEVSVMSKVERGTNTCV